MKLLITEVIWEEGIAELEEQGFDVEYDENLGQDRQRLLKKVADFDGLIIRNQTQVDEELLRAGLNLKVIGRLGVGLDNINITAAKEKGIPVVFAKHANATSVAEYVMSAVLQSNRSFAKASEDVHNGNWNRKLHTGEEVYGKTIGLIGLGEIAHRVAKRAQVFGMDVIGYGPSITENDYIISETGVVLQSSLDELLAASDFVSLHVPLNDSTRGLIDRKALQIMKPSAHLIQTARGGVIDEHALAEALRNEGIRGAFIDVLESEPIDPYHPLLSLSNAVLTPHIAGLTEESQVRTSVLVAKEVSKVLAGKPSLCVV
ncbi:hydroxyacid dehydrogenase [Halobacillus litoralis]|uniref:hydroxyacid dehydrogenase n=1 Tax=Halobacillus litoralis TaxID=45668 RepID=UPI001CFE956A|nr:hydroxyacid dehydrogenase [Halobacillus litoralis]